MNTAIDNCKLDLSGRTVLTEAANGAYVVTPVLAAMAGADVYALALPTAYATTDELVALTTRLAEVAGVSGRITYALQKKKEHVTSADIVTNSGQVRPIDAQMVTQMKSGCVVPLMYESWEYRPADIDLQACREHGILVAGTNEQHPDVDVFSYLGQLAIKQLHEAGIAVRGSRVALLCDNAFGSYIEGELRGNGASVVASQQLSEEIFQPCLDAILVALRPRNEYVLTSDDARLIHAEAPGTVVIQYWGDLDRAALTAESVPVWPERAPGAGHMGVLLSAVGPEAIVRLQTGGLKVGGVLTRGLDNATPEDLAFIQLI